MNKTPYFIGGALALALAVPLLAGAQSQAGAPAPSASAAGTHQHHEHGMMRAIRSLDLSDAQRAQIQQLVQQYRQQYPKGSTPDPAARAALREKIFATLTPGQQAQLKAKMAQMRADRQASGENGAPPQQAAPAPAASPNAR